MHYLICQILLLKDGKQNEEIWTLKKKTTFHKINQHPSSAVKPSRHPSVHRAVDSLRGLERTQEHGALSSNHCIIDGDTWKGMVVGDLLLLEPSIPAGSVLSFRVRGMLERKKGGLCN